MTSKYPSESPPKQIFLTSVFLVVMSASLLGLQIALGTNTLFHGNKWKVEKREKLFGLTGSDEYLSTRAPLFEGVLNLGKWYGHQAVRSMELKDLNSVRLKFKLEEGQILSIKLNDNSYSDVGIVMSRSDKASNVFFGKNTYIRNKLNLTLDGRWSFLDIDIKERVILFHLNGKEIHQLSLNSPYTFSSLTLQSGLKGALVDDVFLVNEKGETFYEGFFDIKKALGLTLFWMLFLAAVKMSLVAFVPGMDIKIAQLLFLVLLVCQSIYYAADRFFLSKYELSPFSKMLDGKDVTSVGNKLEKFRWGMFHFLALNPPGEIPSSTVFAKRGYPKDRIWEGPIVCTLQQCNYRRMETAAHIISRGNSNLVLVGTSQSIGAGASSMGKTFFTILHKQIQEQLKGSRLVSLNLSESGSNPQQLFEKYNKNIEILSPEIFIINLVNNGDDFNYYKGLKNFLELGMKKNSRIFIVQEAISNESDVHLDQRRDFLSSLAGENVHILDLNSFMNSKQEFAGDFRFWDFIHFNNEGHKLAGEWLASQIIKVMSGK